MSMWFANGMSEYDVMALAGHSSFATTHKFYLAVADDLIHHPRATTAQSLCQKLERFESRAIFDYQQKKESSCNCYLRMTYQMGSGGFEPPTHRYSVQCSVVHSD
jgi:hypothetical protein